MVEKTTHGLLLQYIVEISGRGGALFSLIYDSHT